MKVKILKSIATLSSAYAPGIDIELDDNLAANWIATGHAAALEPIVELPPTKGYGVPIDTVFPSSYAEYTREEITKMNATEQHEFVQKHNLAIEGYKKSMKAAELERSLLAFLGFSVE